MITHQVFNHHITGSGNSIKPDMIEIELADSIPEEAEALRLRWVGDDIVSPLTTDLKFKFYQNIDHLEPSDYADLSVVTAVNGKQYVERDLNYTIEKAQVRMFNDGTVAGHFKIADCDEYILCLIGDVPKLRELLKGGKADAAMNRANNAAAPSASQQVRHEPARKSLRP